MDRAVRLATELGHEFVSLEHIMLALMDDREVVTIIEGCGGSTKRLKKELNEFLDKHCPKYIFGDEGNDARERWKPDVTLAFHRLIQRAVIQVHSAEREAVNSSNLLIAFFAEAQSHSVHFLQKEGVSRFDVINFVSHGIPKEESESSEPSEPSQTGEPAPDEEGPQRARGNPLENYCTNLMERAAEGKIDPLIGREDVLDRIAQILCRRTKNNPILVGDPGVGKTAIADGLALKIFEGKVPPKLRGTEIYSLDMGSLLAGTKFRGDFEQRLKGVVKELKKKPKAILFIDEIHTLVGAGATSGGSMDASNLLKPALANRSITCIGSTTHKEFHSHLEKDRAFIRRFQRIDIKEPTTEEAVDILKGLQPHYEKFHDVTYLDEAIRAAAELSAKYIHDRPLPDKAIDVMDEAAARIQMRNEGTKSLKVTVSDIEDVVSSIAKVPAKSVSADDKMMLKNLESELKKSIYGQDDAISKLVTSIKLARSGLRDPQKPIGCFLFTGPTGVGKTEVSRQLAKLLGVELTRFDMSEYMEKHSVARLVGAPPGYVGYDEGGLLTDAVGRNPYTVLLLDEMEKAHPDVSNILLQVMDNGKLTDTSGKMVDFKNVILIMTSNAGAQAVAKQSIGINPQRSGEKAMEAVKSMFSPEFINRLDSIVSFGALGEEVVLQVVDKFLDELNAQLAEKKVKVDLTKKARRWLFDEGFDPAYGARKLGRTIDEHIKKPLVDELLFGKLTNGGTVKVDTNKDGLSFNFK